MQCHIPYRLFHSSTVALNVACEVRTMANSKLQNCFLEQLTFFCPLPAQQDRSRACHVARKPMCVGGSNGISSWKCKLLALQTVWQMICIRCQLGNLVALCQLRKKILCHFANCARKFSAIVALVLHHVPVWLNIKVSWVAPVLYHVPVWLNIKVSSSASPAPRACLIEY